MEKVIVERRLRGHADEPVGPHVWDRPHLAGRRQELLVQLVEGVGVLVEDTVGVIEQEEIECLGLNSGKRLESIAGLLALQVLGLEGELAQLPDGRLVVDQEDLVHARAALRMAGDREPTVTDRAAHRGE